MARKANLRIPRDLINRLSRLLHMRYRVSELARELRIDPRTVRNYLKHGCPYEMDEPATGDLADPEVAAAIYHPIRFSGSCAPKSRPNCQTRRGSNR